MPAVTPAQQIRNTRNCRKRREGIRELRAEVASLRAALDELLRGKRHATEPLRTRILASLQELLLDSLLPVARPTPVRKIIDTGAVAATVQAFRHELRLVADTLYDLELRDDPVEYTLLEAELAIMLRQTLTGIGKKPRD